VALIFPASDVARFLCLRSFASVPIELSDEDVFGTLCAASTGEVTLSDPQLVDMRRCARRIALWLNRTGTQLPVGMGAR
jgi:hypothetical protein